ncbi:hypothetical protein Syn7502_00839 [Synechococcus sp. PCC 7502]|uniref:hypothetical protein n=1 Tax=Synechococcus sp. PCC 7502 TaxID=1173263 RepID=UPI00029FC7D1|nr:hypothetical protein [Synechococcus sp. PCC 7502]AFY72971.1 hypothetical protein Syn7502_00839 [Synechococcus sp. PCC 7502]
MEDKLNQASTQILINQMIGIYNDPNKDCFDKYCAARAINQALGQNHEGQKLKYWFLAFLLEHNQPQTDLF